VQVQPPPKLQTQMANSGLKKKQRKGENDESYTSLSLDGCFAFPKRV
jgi:hypothetical protein